MVGSLTIFTAFQEVFLHEARESRVQPVSGARVVAAAMAMSVVISHIHTHSLTHSFTHARTHTNIHVLTHY